MAKKDVREQLKDWADDAGKKHSITKPIERDDVHRKIKTAMDKERKDRKGF